MNIVVLLAGGRGERANSEIPKQFVEVLEKPLIAYSLEIYEKSTYIDAIEVVVLDGYKERVWDIAKKYKINKLKWVTEGGESCQESTKNGLFYLKNKISDNDYIMLNMSTSIFVDDDIIKDSLETAKKYGSAFACMKCIYNNAESFDGISASNIHRKETHWTLNLPWTAKFSKYYSLYKEANEKGIEMDESSYAPTLFIAMGEKIYFSKDTSLNKLHITTENDIEIVTAILEHRRNTDEVSNGN